MDRREKAVELNHIGHNCCQAVLCAFDDELPRAEDDLNRIGAASGVGMGCMEATCGALCVAEMILGMKKYEGRLILRDAAALHKAFTEKCGEYSGGAAWAIAFGLIRMNGIRFTMTVSGEY